MFRFWGFVILLASSVQAETPPRGYTPEELGITRHSKFYRTLKSRKLIKDQGFVSEYFAKKIIARIESEEGENISVESQPTIPDSIKVSLIKKSQELGEWSNKKIHERGILPNCSESKSQRIEVKSGGSKVPRKSLISDILYLRKHDVPIDTVEVFGPTVEVRPYEQDEKSITYHTAIGLGISCLPFRIRITDSYVDRLQGDDALKNYSRNLTGNGYTHKEAKKIKF